MHTGSDANNVPEPLAAYALIVNFKLTRVDIEEEILDRFLRLAKPRIDSERYGLLHEKVNTLKIIDPLEQDITNFLASDVNLLNNIDTTKKLNDLKKLYDEACDTNIRIASIEEPLIKTRESYREIATRASICYDVINCLKELNTNYVLSFKQFEDLFEESLHQFERFSTSQVIGKFTQSIFNCMSRVMNESDKRVFAILLSFEIESAAGRVRIGEREFIISPHYGIQFMQHIQHIQSNSTTTRQSSIVDNKLWNLKKPFDWMTDETYSNLQYLAITHAWFSDAFERMSRDGRETQWRTLCESETPELVQLPDKLDESLTSVQRFCIIRAARPDRIIQIALAFVSNILGKK